MDIKPIRTKADYRAVLRDIESLMDAELDSAEKWWAVLLPEIDDFLGRTLPG
tara:strand:- start:46 stop:201 length:156 start_codon:yes stop_codon:yes gene_type:complete